MEKREPRVYYSAERENRKAIIIFDAGHAGGDVHIYEYIESRSAKEIEDEMKAYLKVNELPKEALKNLVMMWVEQKFGHAVSWMLT